ncbi:MAG: hypothetical protein JJU35_15255 [Balneolales bacterium]|nr:hypothetical protein [Balneolales bacterium]
MLPDYPLLKDKIQAQFIIQMKEHVKRVFPLQGMTKRQIIHEGTNPEYQSEYKGHYEDELTNLKTFSAEASFNKDELRSMSMKDIFERYLETAEKMGKDIELNSLQELSDKLTEKGQTTSVSKSFTPDDILKAIDSVALSFDENGNAQLPTIMAAPETADKFSEAIVKLDEEPYLSKFREIIDKKRKGWNDRESSRKLVE